MSSKPEPDATFVYPASVRLPHASVLSLAGRDAAAFAQAQFSNDVTALADMQWQWSAWLNPKGRVIALFQLLRLDAEHYWAILPDMPAAALGEQLRRFVFRSKVNVTVQDAAVHGIFGESTASGTLAVRDAAGSIALAYAAGPARGLRIDAPAAAPDAPDLRVDDWRLADIADGVPRLEGSAVEAYTPQMLGLDRLRAYSLKKGCYPGQEIVSRTHYLGQAKRGLQRVALLRPASVGTPLQAEGGARADVVCTASSGDSHEALIVATLAAPVERWQDTEGNECALALPMRDAIVR